MKKRDAIIVGLLMIFLMSGSLVFAVTGESITGKTPSRPTNVSISILNYPKLNINYPENKTYITNVSLLFNYTASYADSVWYNFDNTANTTINSIFHFNISQGSHIVYLYANNSYGLNSSVIANFTINSSLLTIICDEYDGNKKGNSTDFRCLAFEDLQNLDATCIQHIDYGQIYFNEPINITNDLSPTDGLADLDNNINLGLNHIELNSTALPNLDKSATIWIYNLTFTNPRILRDGVICPDSICTQESYQAGTLKFNVTGFSVYSAEESPIVPKELPAPGGGGAMTRLKGIELDKEIINLSLMQGESKKENLTIINTGSQSSAIRLSISGLDELRSVKISEEKFILDDGESKIIDLEFKSNQNQLPELYIGKLIMSINGGTKEIPIAVEVESKELLFNINLQIPEEFKEIHAGQNLPVDIGLYDMAGIPEAGVKIEYIIKDIDDNLIIKKEETAIIDKELNLVKKFKIPYNLEQGHYVLYVRVIYDSKVASTSQWFKVKGRPYIPIIIAVIAIIICYLIISKKRKIRRELRYKFDLFPYLKHNLSKN